MSFWVAIAALCALAIALLALPLRRVGRATRDDAATEDQLRRIAEFEADVAAGEIDGSVADAARAELERAVVDALPPTAATPSHSGRERAALIGICILVPVLALVVYVELGSPQLGAFLAAGQARDLRQPDVALDYLLRGVRERVAAVPDDADAWEILARAELQRDRHDAALAAAERLQELEPHAPRALLLLIDTLVMRGKDGDQARAQALLARVLKQTPDDPTALVLQGMFLQQAGETAQALANWRHALAQIPPAEPLHAELSTMIAGAEAATSRAGPAPRIRLQARVSLAPALRDRAAPGDTVFVFARAAGGPPAPLAVMRHTVADLPLAVTLDETMAMLPGASLADFAKVYVVARVSRAGSARAAAGDLEGRSNEIAVADGGTVDVLIDRVLP